MKQMTRKELYMIIVLVFISLTIVIFPVIKAQRIYEYETIDHYFHTIATQRGMETKDASFFRRSYSMNQDEYQNAQIYGHKGAMEVEEFAIFQVDYANAESVVQACEKRISNLKQSFAGYGTTQTEILEKAVVKQYGNVILCVIGNDGEALLKEMENAL